jgi:hypothetical protein
MSLFAFAVMVIGIAALNPEQHAGLMTFFDDIGTY